MARYYYAVYRCPHCGMKVSPKPENDYCVIRAKYYGNPNEICGNCGKTYKLRHPQMIEAASALTLEQQTPFWITNLGVFVGMALYVWIAPYLVYEAFPMLFKYHIALLAMIVAYLLVCLFSRKKRQEHKNKVLTDSRKRLKDAKYFMQYLLSNITEQEKNTLTPETVAKIHARAIETMDADQPLEIKKIMAEVLEN